MHFLLSFSWFQTFVMFWLLYTFFWVIPRRLNFMCRRFGTLSVPSLEVDRYEEWLGFRMLGYLYGKWFGLKIARAIGSGYFRAISTAIIWSHSAVQIRNQAVPCFVKSVWLFVLECLKTAIICPHRIFMFCMILTISDDYFPKHNFFVIETVYCEVGTATSNIHYLNFPLHRINFVNTFSQFSSWSFFHCTCLWSDAWIIFYSTLHILCRNTDL